MKTRIAYWSAGITSAVACKMALEKYDNVRLVYFNTGMVHKDNHRFKRECEEWYGQEIETHTNSKGYKHPVDVIHKTGYVNGPGGARCTLELKKSIRYELEAQLGENLENQIMGFEYEKKQVNRAIRFLQQYPKANALFPLIDYGITKANCAAILNKAGIEIPEMYKMGYQNNNCIGCVKGGMWYWNKIRKDFPFIFNMMAEAERGAGHSCIKGTFLDELDPNAGRKSKELAPDCGNFCEIELADVPVVNLDKVMSKQITVYEAALLAA